MGWLLIDTENGSKTLGDPRQIKDKLGLPPIIMNQWGELISLYNQLFKRDTVENIIKIDELEIPQKTVMTTLKNPKLPIDGIVVDTFSELVKKLSRQIQGKKEKMEWPDYHKLMIKVDKILEYSNRIPLSMIFNCHSKTENDDDQRVLRVIPAIEGGTKKDVGKWFDFVLYTKIAKRKGGAYEYVWVTRRTEKYCQAKDRSGLLDEEITQEYAHLHQAAKERGWESIKVLIIGEPGSGKTQSLETLTVPF
mgnify:CR=1 FL=1|jgi:hypothetical protein|tara:strand:- start:7304 stop:8053 length:750 start_codon:yes stop_codon:yes gene_type:complete